MKHLFHVTQGGECFVISYLYFLDKWKNLVGWLKGYIEQTKVSILMRRRMALQ